MSIVFSKGSGSMNPPKKSPEKPPLITPSASPPPRPSLARSYRAPNGAPPLKRRRLASTPHQAPHNASSSSTSRPQSPADVQMEREASKLRLLDVWSSLAERYSRRLDEDDIVDIRTGEIIQDRGFIRNSRKVDFGAIAALVTGDAMAEDGTDEDEDDEYDTDELDAFADATSELDKTEQSEIGLRVGPVPPLTAMDSADAEDLRAFLEAEQRRKQLCGSEVEEDDDSAPNTPNQGSEVEVESAADSEDLDPSLPNDVADASTGTYPGSQTALFVDSSSEDELDNWDIDESSIVHPVLKHVDNPKDSQHETLRKNSRSPSPSGSFSRHPSSRPQRRKSVSSDSGTVETSVMQKEEKSERHLTPRMTSSSDDLPHPENQASTFCMISEEKFIKPKLTRRSSLRSRRRPTPGSSVSGSGSESGNSSDSEPGYSRKAARSHYNNFQFPPHYPYPHHHHQSYRKQQKLHHPPPFVPPVPDPRAQFIITQAMQQLSALVGTPWIPPHDPPSIPCTPRRHQSRRANSIFNTPSYHPHPYPYSYDPNLSHATLPPESPELASSPEKSSSHGPLKSSMAKSRSRGRRVSFKIDESSDGDNSDGGRSSPSKIPSSSRRQVVAREKARQSTTTTITKPSERKGKARAETPALESSSEEDPLDCGNDGDGRKFYSRGQTPGPDIGSPRGMKKRGQGLQRRLKSTS